MLVSIACDHTRSRPSRWRRQEERVAHHKRRRKKDRRAGCLYCKFHKSNGCKGMAWAQTRQEKVSRFNEREQRLSERDADEAAV